MQKINDHFLSILVAMIFLISAALLVINLLKIESFQPNNSEQSNSIAMSNLNMDQPLIQAQSALVWDKKNNLFVYEKNSDQARPIASITKTLTAIASLEYLPKESPITITHKDLVTEGQSGLIAGEKWQRDDLIIFTLITSSNDGAEALSRSVEEVTGQPITESFTTISKKLNLKNYSWRNSTGLDTIDGIEASNSASAKDVIKIIDYLLVEHPHIALQAGSPTSTFQTNFKTHIAETTNHLATIIPHTLSAKTGFTLVAGGNLVIITDIGPARPIYIVVLGSTINDRFNDTEELYNYTIKYINNYDL